MKLRVKKFAAFLLAVILLCQTIPFEILTVYADGEKLPQIKIDVKDNNESVKTATVKATVSGNEYNFGYDETEDAFLSQGTVSSADLVSGTYPVTIESDGYETVETTISFTKNDVVLSGKYTDMHAHKLHTIHGEITDKNNCPLRDAFVQVKDTDIYAVTNSAGSYELSLVNGTYTLIYGANGYAQSTEVITVNDGDMKKDMHLSKTYSLIVSIQNSTLGKVTVSYNGTEKTQNTADKSYTCKEGDQIVVTAQPKENGRLSVDCENQMRTNAGEGILDDGSSFYQVIQIPQDLENLNNNQFRIEFEEAEKAVLKSNGNEIYYYRKGQNGTISVSGNTFTATPDSAHYVHNVNCDGSDAFVVSQNGTVKQYGFSSADANTTYVTFSKDMTGPEIMLSDRNIGLWKDSYLDDDGYYQLNGGNNYWYISDSTLLYADISDNETEIANVGVLIGKLIENVYNNRNHYGWMIYRNDIDSDPAGKLITITATNGAGISSNTTIHAYYDKEAPKVTSVSINNPEYLFNQNGTIYVGDDNINVKANIEDQFGIKNIYYMVDSVSLNSAQIQKVYEADKNNQKFLKKPVNKVTYSSEELSIDIDTTKNETGEWYIYILAEDLAGNIDFKNAGRCHFLKDATPPTVNKLTDISGHSDIYKRGSDAICLKGSFTDQETPSGMQYAVTAPEKLLSDHAPLPRDKQQIKSDQSLVWHEFGDRDSSQQTYDDIRISVSNNQLPGSYVVWVYAKDGCGNISDGAKYIFHIDDQAPVIRTLSFDVKENSKPAAGRFFRFGNFFRKNTVDKKTQTVQIRLNAQDLPQQDDNGEDVNYYQGARFGIKELKLYYVTGEESGEADAYRNDIQNQRVLPAFAHTEAPSEINKIDAYTAEYTFLFEIPENEVFYRLMAAATDYAGNCTYYVPTMSSAYLSDQVMLDRKAPVLKMELEESFRTPDYTKGKKRWYKGSRKVSYVIDVEDADAGLFETILTINDKNILKEGYTTTETTKATPEKQYTLAASGQMVDKKDGHVTYEASVQDNAGNIARAERTIYIDQDEPVIREMLFSDKLSDDLSAVPMQYGYFFRKRTQVIVKATDYIGETETEGSGIKNMTYYLRSFDGSKTQEKTIHVTKDKDNVYTGGFYIPQGFKGQIYVKAEDQTGQECRYVNPKGTVIEDEADHAQHAKAEIKLPDTSYKDEEGNPLYNYLPTLKYETKDTKSGIRQNVWSVKPFHLGSNEAEGTLDVTAVYAEQKDAFESSLSGDTDWTVSKKPDLNLITTADRSYTVKNQMNHIEAELQLTDNVGNKTKKEVKIFSVDTTNPEIEVEYNNNDVQNEKYYKEPRVATITVTERNFFKEGAEIITTGDNVKVGEWQHHAGGGCNGTVHTDACTYTCDVTFDEDGEYTFTVNCTDLAGNQGSYGQTDEFVIDLTKPVINVTYDNNDVRNGSYYKEQRTATITIKEKNFDDERTIAIITAQMQGAPIDAPALSAFVKSEDMNTATVSYEEEGDYSFSIEVTDLAGNEAEIFTPQTFTVDMTPPELIVEGVEDGSANQGVVAPSITYSDVNLEEDTAEITLTGANLGKVNFDKRIGKVDNGIKIDLGDFKHQKEVDDLYTLEVTVEDLAGNEATDTRVFSVNRFGSVYVLSDDTKELVDHFYTNREKDLIITEINVDTLEFTEIDSSIDGDILTLEEGRDYEVKRAYTDKKWKAYEYHIAADNFEKEGAYVVTIYSEDKAKNKSSNKAKGKELSFVVDKTAPSIVVAGIEDGGQYRQVSRDITLDVQDNVLLDDVDVYVDGGLIQTTGQESLLESNGIVKVTLQGANKRQILSVISTDAAGNRADSAQLAFLITRNLFIQWYANKPVFFGSLGIVFAAGSAMIVIFGRRRSKMAAAE